MRAHAVQHALDRRRVGAVAADQAVPAQQPDVARPADRPLRHVRARRRDRSARRCGSVRNDCDLVGVEAGERQVEAVGLQIAQFDAQQVLVPAGRERQAVVGQDVGAASGRA